MKKILLFLTPLIFAAKVYGQLDSTLAKSKIDTTISLNLLRSPASPASNLLGIAANEIQRPTDVKAFMVSIQNASQGFSTIPTSFGIDIAPYWFSKDRKQFIEQTSKSKNPLRSLVLSVAVRNFQSQAKLDSTTQLAGGFRIALFKGKYDSKVVSDIYRAFEAYADVFDAKKLKDPTFQKLKSLQDSLGPIAADENRSHPKSQRSKDLSAMLTKVDSSLSQRLLELQAIIIEEKKGKVKEFIESRPVRTGFKLDLSGGIAWDFPDSRFDSGKILKASMWITSGHEWVEGHALFGIVRYQYNPDKIFADENEVLRGKSVGTLDGGIRYNFQGNDNPFVFSSEFIYRSALTAQVEDSWRLVANASYEVSQNTILTLSLGRDFDRTFKKDGNVAAFLNFVKGFGK